MTMQKPIGLQRMEEDLTNQEDELKGWVTDKGLAIVLAFTVMEQAPISNQGGN